MYIYIYIYIYIYRYVCIDAQSLRRKMLMSVPMVASGGYIGELKAWKRYEHI